MKVIRLYRTIILVTLFAILFIGYVCLGMSPMFLAIFAGKYGIGSWYVPTLLVLSLPVTISFCLERVEQVFNGIQSWKIWDYSSVNIRNF